MVEVGHGGVQLKHNHLSAAAAAIGNSSSSTGNFYCSPTPYR